MGNGGKQEQGTCKTLFKDDLYNFRRINEGKKGLEIFLELFSSSYSNISTDRLFQKSYDLYC